MSLGQLLSQGGWAMWPIYLCSFVALFVFCERIIMFWGIRAKQLSWLPTILNELRSSEFEKVIQTCAENKHPIARVLGASTEMLRF